MKKILSLVVISSCIIGGYIFAQGGAMLGNMTDQDIEVKVGATIPDQIALSNINIAFCNDGLDNITRKGLLTIRPGQTKEICMVFANSSEKESIAIVATFVDTSITDGGNMACSLGVNETGKSLASYISFDQEAYRFTLAPGETIIRKAKLHIPQDAELGIYNGCVGYNLDIKKDENDTGLFFVVRRKVGLMEITVDGEVYKFGLFDNVKYIYNSNKVMILKTLARIIGIVLIYYIVVTVKGSKSHQPKKKK